MSDLAMVNGVVSSLDSATISVNDRGLLFGDAVYEVVAVYHGKLFLFDAHMRRLKRSLGEMQMLEAVDIRLIRAQIRKLLKLSKIDQAKIYLQISRGTAPRAHPYPKHPQPNLLITVSPLKRYSAALFRKGVSVISVADERWSRCDIKTVNLLGNVRAKQAALDAGAFDALMIGHDGILHEATAANAFMVKDDTAFTHPSSHCILGGVTCDHLIKLGRKSGIKVVERATSLDQFYAADEVFLSGTTTEVMPVVGIDDRKIGKGRPGALTKKFYSLLMESMANNR
ncbi:MAG: aminotransferase class IV [Candidatus Alcyoniella australis]|nr:aminotransferase class IV [Candidatus Alcyoniella australis]